MTTRTPRTLSPNRIEQLKAMDKQQLKNPEEIQKTGKLVSIITPVFNTNPEYLQETFASVKNQTYTNWEWCVCDDGSTEHETVRILNEISVDKKTHITHLYKNSGIVVATSSAAKQATGEILVFLDHDDMLHVDALTEIVNTFNKHDADIVYTDEAMWRIDKDYSHIHAKPNFSPHYLWSTNYICHLLAVKKSVYDAIGGLRQGFEGSQDHDLILQLTHITKKIFHIPKCLYYWRIYPGSYSRTDHLSIAIESGIKAIKKDLDKRGLPGTVTAINNETHYSTKIDIIDSSTVHIIIPTFSISQTLLNCLTTLSSITSYRNYKISLVTNSIENTVKCMDILPPVLKNKIKIISEYPMPFNMAKTLNTAIKQVEGKYIIIMHDDVIIQNPDWIEWLIGYAQDSTVGAVSGKIIDDANQIIEFGGMIGIDGQASSMFKGIHVDAPGDFGRAQAIQNTSIVFSTLMAFTKNKFTEISGFDERYALSNFDLDFCLRLKARGYFNVILPACKAKHAVSGRRSIFYPKSNLNSTIHSDKTTFTAQYNHLMQQVDPYYSPILVAKQEKILTNTIKTLMTVKDLSRKITQQPQTIVPKIPIPERPISPTKKLTYRWNNPFVLVSYIVPWYDQTPTAVVSLLTQTYPNIEIILVHDGPLTSSASQYVKAFNDKRIKLFNTPKRYNDWGHTPRNYAIDKLSPESAAVVLTGADNYYLPSFTLELFSVLCQEPQASATYCDMIHNEKNWTTVVTSLKYAYIDCGCFMVRPEIAKEFRWDNKVSWEDWAFIEKVINKYTEDSIVKIPRALYVHN